MTAFRDLDARKKTSPDAAAKIPTFCSSVALKLSNADGHLQNILAITEWDYLTASSAPPTVSGSGLSGGTGVTMTTTSSSIYSSPIFPTISTKSAFITNHLDDFFSNIFSTLDVFAQILNLFYLSPPMKESDVYFFDVVKEIAALPAPKDQIKKLLSGCLKAPLYVNAKKYRKITTHSNSLRFRVLTESDPFALVQLPPKIAAIFIPDNPRVAPLTYLEKRDFRSFGPRVLKHTQAIVNSSYGIMERTVRAVDQIPV